MNTACFFRVFVLALGLLLISTSGYASKKMTAKERKERANVEYARCMAITKEKGVPATLAYIREQQTGTALASSPEKLAEENCAADAMELPRYQDLDEILADEGDELVELSSPLIKIKDDVPQSRHFACSWTCGYLTELATYVQEKLGHDANAENPKAELLVASLVRSKVNQDALSRVKVFYKRIKKKLKKFISGGRSFADCSSRAVCSTHLTGATVDISLLGADRKTKKLLVARLLEDREKGRVLAIFERAGNHFHILVIPPQYVPSETPAS